MSKHYTFRVVCSFTMQHTFTEDEMEPDPEGGEGDVVPTDEGMLALQRELEEHLRGDYVVDEVELDTDSDALLGVEDCGWRWRSAG